MKWFSVGVLLLTAAAQAADWAAVKAEPVPEKRSEQAVAYADQALQQAKAAWRAGDAAAFNGRLGEIRDAVDLCLSSLQETGRPPHKLLKWYKGAELKTRELSRRLEAFALEVGIEDRPAVDKVNQRVQTVHEELLLGALSRKK